MLGLFDKNEPYILASYGVAILGLVGIALWAWRSGRAARRQLEALEGRARRAPNAQTPDTGTRS